MITLKLNKNILKHKAGAVISVDCDNYGNIKDSFWARRLKDSEIDSCIEIVEPLPAKKSFEKNQKDKK